ncbi:HAMP domain-containing histidine kinase [bacterium]|nr:HAMP domain-containing histidine kinase [bacterium]
MLNTVTTRESIKPDHGYGGETDLLILLGVASSMLSHRISSAIAILGMRVSQLKKCISYDDQSGLNLIMEMKETLRDLDRLSRAIEVLKWDEPSPLDVNSLLYDVWETISANYTSKALDVSFDFPEDVPSIRAYSSLLEEVFRTVLENSLEAIDKTDKETGYISICSRHTCENDAVEIEIKDNGVGIPSEILLGLFQRPVPSSKLSKGIGLWLARLMLTRFGGEIGVQHTGVGQGTMMKITLPAIRVLDTSMDGNHD